MKAGNRLLLICLLIALPGTAQAYIDPGTGSMFLQLVLGGVAGLVVILQLYWRRIKELFPGRKPPPSDSAESSGESS